MSIDYQRLEKTLTREFRQYHVAAQVYRVALVFLGLLTAQLATGWHDWTWKGLIALAAAAGYGALRQVFPTVPWKPFLGHVRLAQAAAEQQDAQAARETVDYSVLPGPPSAKVYTPVTPERPPKWNPPTTNEQSPDERPDPAPAP